MGKIFETTMTAAHWSESEGQGLPIGELSIDEDEVLDPDSLRDVDPEEEFEGYTGNAGMTLERWYRHVSISIWPERRHFAIFCGRDSRAVIPVLVQRVTRLRRSRSKDAADLKGQCLDLAAAILRKWPEGHQTPAGPEVAWVGDLLEAPVGLDEPRLIAAYVGDMMLRDVSVDPGKLLAACCQT